jgi:IS5 family transposase
MNVQRIDMKQTTFAFTKVRYRALAKNTARLFTAFALANLYMVRRGLMPPGKRCLC